MAEDTNKTQKRESTHAAGQPQENYKSYVKLRTMLDSLELGALKYYTEKNIAPQEREKRLKELEKDLMPIIKKLWGIGRDIGCPPGYSDCGGCCVPYDCLPGVGNGY